MVPVFLDESCACRDKRQATITIHESQQVREVREVREGGLLGHGSFPSIYVTLELVDAQRGNAVDNAA